MNHRKGFVLLLDVIALLGLSMVFFMIVMDFGQRNRDIQIRRSLIIEERNQIDYIVRKAQIQGYCDHPNVYEVRRYALGEDYEIFIYEYRSSRFPFSLEFGIVTQEGEG